jgi:hypothetical protein
VGEGVYERAEYFCEASGKNECNDRSNLSLSFLPAQLLTRCTVCTVYDSFSEYFFGEILCLFYSHKIPSYFLIADQTSSKGRYRMNERKDGQIKNFVYVSYVSSQNRNGVVLSVLIIVGNVINCCWYMEYIQDT